MIEEDTLPQNGANGAILFDPLITNDDCHWPQWQWGAPLAPLGLLPMDCHWHHFLSPLAQMTPIARVPNRNNTFAFSSVQLNPRRLQSITGSLLRNGTSNYLLIEVRRSVSRLGGHGDKCQ